jgi:hypothetical protein
VEVGHFQAKFTGYFSLLIVSTFVLLGSLSKTTSGESWNYLKITGLQFQLSLLRGRGSTELVEKVVMSNTGDSTISHKSEVLPEAKAEGPQRKRRRSRDT